MMELIFMLKKKMERSCYQMMVKHYIILNLVAWEVNRTSRRKELLDQILVNYGVKLKANELVAEANGKNFAQRKHDILSAIAEANDLYFLAKHTVASVFRDDVKGFLDDHEIIYTPHFLAKGSTGIEFAFDFQIAYPETEIVIKPFNNLTKMNLPHFLFTWEDIKVIREKQSGKNVNGLAIINDNDGEQSEKEEYINLISSKGADYIFWSQRYIPDNINKLKAA